MGRVTIAMLGRGRGGGLSTVMKSPLPFFVVSELSVLLWPRSQINMAASYCRPKLPVPIMIKLIDQLDTLAFCKDCHISATGLKIIHKLC